MMCDLLVPHIFPHQNNEETKQNGHQVSAVKWVPQSLQAKCCMYYDLPGSVMVVLYLYFWLITSRIERTKQGVKFTKHQENQICRYLRLEKVPSIFEVT